MASPPNPDDIDDNTEEGNSYEEKFKDVPLEHLNRSNVFKISLYLNSPGEMFDDIINDYQGLAEMVGFSSYEIAKFKRERNPTAALFDEWIGPRKNLKPNLWNLWKYLREMGRIDILHDMRGIFEECAERYHTAPIVEPEEQPTVKKEYDSYVISAFGPAESAFVPEMVHYLEGVYNLRLYIRGRDDTPGEDKFETQSFVMTKRCWRCLVLLSRSTYADKEVDHLIKQAKAIAPSARSKFLIPVIIEKGVSVPLFLNDLDKCDFSVCVDPEWCWKQLNCVIRSSLYIPQVSSSPKIVTTGSSTTLTTDSQSKNGLKDQGKKSDKNSLTVEAKNRTKSEPILVNKNREKPGSNSINSAPVVGTKPMKAERGNNKTMFSLHKISQVFRKKDKRKKHSESSVVYSANTSECNLNQGSGTTACRVENRNLSSTVQINGENNEAGERILYTRLNDARDTHNTEDDSSLDSGIMSISNQQLGILGSQELLDATQSASSEDEERSPFEEQSIIHTLVNRGRHMPPNVLGERLESNHSHNNTKCPVTETKSSASSSQKEVFV